MRFLEICSLVHISKFGLSVLMQFLTLYGNLNHVQSRTFAHPNL